MFRLNLYLPLLFAIVLMLGITVFSIIYVQEKTIHTTKENVSVQFSNFLDKNIQHETSVIAEYMRFIQQNNEIASAFQKNDKAELYQNTKEIYHRLGKSIELTHMYFILPDGSVLLRVHDYGRDLDIVNRATFLRAKETQSLVYGLEFGIKKNFTLRVVQPWYINGNLVGYIELGKEIDKIIDEYTNLLDAKVYLAIKKDNFLDSPDFFNSYNEQNQEFDDYYIAYQTFETPHAIGSILDGSSDHRDLTFNERDYYASKMKLTDFSKKDLGYFVFLQDVTLEHKVIHNSVISLGIVLVLLSGLFFVIGSVLIRRKEKNINTLTSELKKQKTELELFSTKLQNIFDLQKNIVILTDGKRLQMANRIMYDFFGYKDLNDFLQRYNCICERFIEDDTFFHLGKVPEGEIWVETIKALPQEEQIVAILDKEQNTYIFSVAVNEFETGNYVIAFTDISSTMREQVKLMQQVFHDPLTEALNREFLHKNFKRILKDAEPFQLAVILGDIDHFKRVNDTYGHNCGDAVLKQFVEILQSSIRNEDYLIRWGGEEFIVLMKIDSDESLRKAVEHLRENIESSIFPAAGHITASFGATLYHPDESLTECIERSDKALYTAKRDGRNRASIL